MREDYMDKLRALATHYGLNSQLRKTQEELHELDFAIRDHLATPTPKTRENIVEELTDCELLFAQLKHLLNISEEELDLYCEFKTHRQAIRLGMKGQTAVGR